jgi:hypothetical protein
MNNGKFIRCRDCDAVHHVVGFLRSPAVTMPCGEAGEPDDWHAFMREHAGHSLEPLTAMGEVEFVKGVLGDPMAVAYIRVTNGQEEFLLRRARSKIAEPLKFEFVSCR